MKTKALLLAVVIVGIMASSATAKKYHYSPPHSFDLHGCLRHLRAIAKAVKDAGGEVKENDGSDRSYRIILNGKTTIYTCTRYELLETELYSD